ncbi:LCP family protein [Nocardioides dubius]|uniref:Cell envelope-related transcriptional attenuator domain-containing protein n=1 Tax=Nocardioides dubius TaxID=317019 RepID=A0ABP4EIW1_9ACTN
MTGHTSFGPHDNEGGGDDGSALGEPPAAPEAGSGIPGEPTLAGGIPVRERRRRKRSPFSRLKHWMRRHKALTTLIAIALALLLAVIGWLWYLNREMDDVTRFHIDGGDRPARVAGDQLNVLMLGVDDLDYSENVGPDVYDMLESGEWERGAFRSDTMMLAHLEAGRRAAQVVSIPRDSWVDIPGEGRSKINAAFSWGGPELAVRTVEQNFGIYIDHVVVVNFGGFEDISEAVDGVTVFVPEEVGADPRYKPSGVWERGYHNLEGKPALGYVRQRYGLPGGDFDRIDRQQNFLRSLLDKLASRGTLLNPVRLTRLTQKLSELIAVDDTLTSGKMREIALSSRHLRSSGIRFVTLPNNGSGMEGSASVVKVDFKRATSMFEAIASDQFEAWLSDNQVGELPPPDQVD